MNSEDYIKERIDNQISWYDHEGSKNKKKFYRLRILEIVFALSISFLGNVLIEKYLWLSIMTGVLGLLIALIASILALSKYHENWIEYRSTSEYLKSEKLMFLTKSGPYSEDQSFQNLVQRIEGVISKENSKWYKLQSENKIK